MLENAAGKRPEAVMVAGPVTLRPQLFPFAERHLDIEEDLVARRRAAVFAVHAMSPGMEHEGNMKGTYNLTPRRPSMLTCRRHAPDRGSWGAAGQDLHRNGYRARMCGRFTQRLSWAELHELMGLIGPPLDLPPRYNVAPGQDVAIVRAAETGRTGGGRRLAMLCWGLVPTWARDPAIGRKLINARSETVAEKPAFRAAYRHRRCLVPADGFYEWQRRDGTPAAMAVRPPRRLALRVRRPLGALDPAGEPAPPDRGPGQAPPSRGRGAPAGSLFGPEPGGPVETFTILTTAANETVAAVHGRMPVILPPDSWDPWLAGADIALGPCPADGMQAHPVSTLVNRPANNDPRCVEPVSLG